LQKEKETRAQLKNNKGTSSRGNTKKIYFNIVVFFVCLF